MEKEGGSLNSNEREVTTREGEGKGGSNYLVVGR